MSDHRPADLPAPDGPPVSTGPPTIPPASPPGQGQGRPDLTGRIRAAVASAGAGDKRAALAAALDDTDRGGIRGPCEVALGAGLRPLDSIVAAFGVDLATAEAMCREAM